MRHDRRGRGPHPPLEPRDELRRTLEALRRQTASARVTVVDNGSEDESHVMLEHEFQEVRCLRLGENRGFGGAINRGVAASDAKLIVLLNNDTVPDPGFVEGLVAAQERTGAEAAAGCLRRPDGAIESLGIEIDRSLVAYDIWHGEPYARLGRDAPPEPLGPSGGAGAYLRDALVEVGGFDEELFAYLEDVDLAIRMRLAGMRCVVAPEAFAWHEHSATLGSEVRRRIASWARAADTCCGSTGAPSRPATPLAA